MEIIRQGDKSQRLNFWRGEKICIECGCHFLLKENDSEEIIKKGANIDMHRDRLLRGCHCPGVEHFYKCPCCGDPVIVYRQIFHNHRD